MGWVGRCRGSTIAVDTAPIIYYIERRSPYIETLRPFFAAVDAGDIHLVTSVITLLEVLIQPIRVGNDGLAHQYNDILLSSRHVTTAAVTTEVAQTAAEIRATNALKTPDSIQLATAAHFGASGLLTNDREFASYQGVEIMQLDELTAQVDGG